MFSAKHAPFLLLNLIVIAGCMPSSGPPISAQVPADPWRRVPDVELRLAFTKSGLTLPVDSFVPVPEDHRDTAIKVLNSESAIDVSGKAPWTSFADETGLVLDGQKLLLVRALTCSSSSNSSFTITVLGPKLLVEHGTLGAAERRVERMPLLLVLKEVPEEVYVNCSMAL